MPAQNAQTGTISCRDRTESTDGARREQPPLAQPSEFRPGHTVIRQTQQRMFVQRNKQTSVHQRLVASPSNTAHFKVTYNGSAEDQTGRSPHPESPRPTQARVGVSPERQLAERRLASWLQ